MVKSVKLLYKSAWAAVASSIETPNLFVACQVSIIEPANSCEAPVIFLNAFSASTIETTRPIILSMSDVAMEVNPFENSAMAPVLVDIAFPTFSTLAVKLTALSILNAAPTAVPSSFAAAALSFSFLIF